MKINEAILIKYQGGFSFGVIRKKVVTEDEKGESTNYQCEVLCERIDGEKPILVPIYKQITEDDVLPLELFQQYGRAREFWTSSPGYIWAEKRAEELEELKRSLEIAEAVIPAPSFAPVVINPVSPVVINPVSPNQLPF